MLDLTEPQLDFILEMAAKEDPKRWSFVRPGRGNTDESTVAAAKWADVLMGAALMGHGAIGKVTELSKKFAARKPMMGLTGKGLGGAVKDNPARPGGTAKGSGKPRRP